MSKNKNVPLLVTTAHRGVFFGYGQVTEAKIITLEQCRMCVSWSADIKGVVGLAVTGPSKSCRIGPAAPRVTLQDVTAVMEVTPEAVKNWGMMPWN